MPLPPSLANATPEELQRLIVDSLRKLKSRDKRITELTAANEKSAAELAALQGQSSSPDGSFTGAGEDAAAVQLQVRLLPASNAFYTFNAWQAVCRLAEIRVQASAVG